MRVTVVNAPFSDRTATWVASALRRHGHQVDLHRLAAPDAGSGSETGHRLRELWSREGAPDVALALDWPAGVAAHVGARGTEVPVVVRLARVAAGRAGTQNRLEVGLARSSHLLLVSSVGQMHLLADRGAPRSALRVLPEPVDRTVFPDVGSPPGRGHRVGLLASTPAGGGSAGMAVLPGCERVALDPELADRDLAKVLPTLSALVVLDDSQDEVALTVRAMACAVPVVAVDHGVLADLVADGVTGRLVQPGEITDAVRSLLADPMGREAMGLAAVDRVRARFDVEVVGEGLVRFLAEAARHDTPTGHGAGAPELSDHLVAVGD